MPRSNATRAATGISGSTPEEADRRGGSTATKLADQAARPRSKWREKYKVHPAADEFPMMSDEGLAKLGEDIKANGLKNPIVFWHGVLIDGRAARRHYLDCCAAPDVDLDAEQEIIIYALREIAGTRAVRARATDRYPDLPAFLDRRRKTAAE